MRSESTHQSGNQLYVPFEITVGPASDIVSLKRSDQTKWGPLHEHNQTCRAGFLNPAGQASAQKAAKKVMYGKRHSGYALAITSGSRHLPVTESASAPALSSRGGAMSREQDAKLEQVAACHRRQIQLILASLPVNEVHQLLSALAIGLDGLKHLEALKEDPR